MYVRELYVVMLYSLMEEADGFMMDAATNEMKMSFPFVKIVLLLPLAYFQNPYKTSHCAVFSQTTVFQLYKMVDMFMIG